MASTLPDYNTSPTSYDVDYDAELVQNGSVTRPSFFGDVNHSSLHSIFLMGVSTALSYSGNRFKKQEVVDKRNKGDIFNLTREEFALLEQRSLSISSYSKIPYDTCEDFLTILCFVDNINDMTKIADAVQIPELADEKILRQPMLILNLPNLEKIGFAAQALDGLINLYRKYLTSLQNQGNYSDNEDSSSVLSTISRLASGLGGFALVNSRIDTGNINSFLVENITNEKVPTNVIAKNPMMQSPSYVGKTMFGESPNSLSNVDIDQLFSKAIAIFPIVSNGLGTSSFTMQNFGSFATVMPLTNFISKIMFGSSTYNTGSYKETQILQIADKVNTFTGSKNTDSVDIRRSDNAIPMMMGLSSAFSGYDKLIFSDSSFKNGWTTAQSAGNIMSIVNPSFIETARRFL